MQAWLTAPRCFVDQPDLVSGILTLSKEEGRHLTRVRRIAKGRSVSVLNGLGDVGMGRLLTSDREVVEISVERVLKIEAISPEITLCIAALKQSAWDEVLKHAVELGLNRIIRIQTDHAVSELKSDKTEKKMQRWRLCMIEACKQSANPWLPSFELCGNVAEAVERLQETACLQLLAGMTGNPRPLAEVLPLPLPKKIVVWVGPEGDFSLGEIACISRAGAQSVQLGARILRAETATLALLSRLRL